MTREVVFWLQTLCRSTVPLVRYLAERKNYSVSLVVQERINEHRKSFGWKPDECGGAKLTILAKNNQFASALKILDNKFNALHIIGGYQRNFLHTRIIDYLIRKNILFGIMSESPINFESGYRKLAKDAYLSTWLKFTTKQIAKKSQFFISLSGRRTLSAISAGWSFEKIYPFGYFPESRDVLCRLDIPNTESCRILCLGALQKFKGVDNLLLALALARNCGGRFKCEIVGDGNERKRLSQLSLKLGLDDVVHFHGFISDAKLDQIIEKSDLLVAPGTNEPWGIKINDAINCGLAIICSDGIGASELVVSGQCGSVFHSGDIGELAHLLVFFTQNSSILRSFKLASRKFKSQISPFMAASHLTDIIEAMDERISPLLIPPWLKIK